MKSKSLKSWDRIVSAKKNGVRGVYGITDFNKKTITINKKRHAIIGRHGDRTKKNKDGSANLLDTLVHEEMHAKHPKMREKTVRKLTPKSVKKMSKTEKNKVYSRFNK